MGHASSKQVHVWRHLQITTSIYLTAPSHRGSTVYALCLKGGHDMLFAIPSNQRVGNVTLACPLLKNVRRVCPSPLDLTDLRLAGGLCRAACLVCCGR
jgi:hypothetical protein